MKKTTRILTILSVCSLMPMTAHASSPAYVVQAGDTLMKIARENQTTVEDLMQANQLTSDRLSIGQSLTLPGTAAPPAQTVADVTASENEAPADIIASTHSSAIRPGMKARITGDVVNVRKSPSLEAEVVGKLPMGAVVEVLEPGVEWTKISFDQRELFVSTAFLNEASSFSSDESEELEAPSFSSKKLHRVFEPLLHTPYVTGGTTPDGGFDCSGFTFYVFKKLGIALPRTSEEQFRGGQAVPLEKAVPGDLIFYDTMKNGRVSHVAIYLGDGMMVHANGDEVRYEKLENMHKLYPFFGVKRYVSE
ncbi:C40 family peptidase [Brevibacillus borstelensis]|uniref:C40 family peptidase n=1 Tax=Brevibacillus borstelensis TaxID=45462 RepID=UPI0030C28DD8